MRALTVNARGILLPRRSFATLFVDVELSAAYPAPASPAAAGEGGGGEGGGGEGGGDNGGGGAAKAAPLAQFEQSAGVLGDDEWARIQKKLAEGTAAEGAAAEGAATTDPASKGAAATDPASEASPGGLWRQSWRLARRVDARPAMRWDHDWVVGDLGGLVSGDPALAPGPASAPAWLVADLVAAAEAEAAAAAAAAESGATKDEAGGAAAAAAAGSSVAVPAPAEVAASPVGRALAATRAANALPFLITPEDPFRGRPGGLFAPLASPPAAAEDPPAEPAEPAEPTAPTAPPPTEPAEPTEPAAPVAPVVKEGAPVEAPRDAPAAASKDAPSSPAAADGPSEGTHPDEQAPAVPKKRSEEI